MVAGFYICTRFGKRPEYLIDLISGTPIEWIRKIPTISVRKFIESQELKRNDEKLWQIWLAQFPWMTTENYISFDDFKKQQYMSAVDTRSTSEIADELHDIEKQFEQKGKDDGTV